MFFSCKKEIAISVSLNWWYLTSFTYITSLVKNKSVLSPSSSFITRYVLSFSLLSVRRGRA